MRVLIIGGTNFIGPYVVAASTDSARWTHGYVENVAYAIALTVLNQEAAGRVYNIGESSVPTMAERVRLIGHAAGWDGAIVPLPADRLPRHLRTPYEPQQDLVTDVTCFRILPTR